MSSLTLHGEDDGLRIPATSMPCTCHKSATSVAARSGAVQQPPRDAPDPPYVCRGEQPMSPQGITVLGECVADAFAEPASGAGELALRVLPGGGPANTAVALARLGTPARFLARLSGDVFGRLFRAHLEASGVDFSHAVSAVEPSTLAVAELDALGQASFSFHAQHTADWQWTAAELAPVSLS